MTQITEAATESRTGLTLLCLLAGLAALAGFSAVMAALLFGIGPGGLVVALVCGVLALGAGSWAAVLACDAPRPTGPATAPGS
jgi:ABC-type transport system involved in cytochrome c biogenesis permease component